MARRLARTNIVSTKCCRCLTLGPLAPFSFLDGNIYTRCTKLQCECCSLLVAGLLACWLLVDVAAIAVALAGVDRYAEALKYKNKNVFLPTAPYPPPFCPSLFHLLRGSGPGRAALEIAFAGLALKKWQRHQAQQLAGITWPEEAKIFNKNIY